MGLTLHLGQGDSGHYYSLIRERTEGRGGAASGSGRWLEFNDARVVECQRPAAYGLMPAEAAEEQPPAMAYGATAYLLWYEACGADGAALPGEAAGGGAAGAPTCWAVAEVERDNAALMLQSRVFSEPHLAFVDRLFAEEAEAFRAGELDREQGAQALLQGVHFVCSTLAHAADPRLAAVFASLRTLCSPLAGTHLLLTLGDDQFSSPLLRSPLLLAPAAFASAYADLLLYASRSRFTHDLGEVDLWRRALFS